MRESEGVDFSGIWALTVEWTNVRSYDQVSFNRNPFFDLQTSEFLNSVSWIARATLNNLLVIAM